MTRPLRLFLALAGLTIAATVAAIGLIVETPRRHPRSINKGWRYE